MHAFRPIRSLKFLHWNFYEGYEVTFVFSQKTKIITVGKFWFENFSKNCVKWSPKRQGRSVNRDLWITNSNPNKFSWIVSYSAGKRLSEISRSDENPVQRQNFLLWQHYQIFLTLLYLPFQDFVWSTFYGNSTMGSGFKANFVCKGFN